ncbi:ATP-binding protein [Myxococcota bacterium]
MCHWRSLGELAYQYLAQLAVGGGRLYRDAGPTPSRARAIRITVPGILWKVMMVANEEQLRGRLEGLRTQVAELEKQLGSSRRDTVAQLETDLHSKEEQYAQLFDKMINGFALHEIICDEAGKPCDYRFLEANPAFELQTGLKRLEILGKTVKEVLPGIESSWIDRYGRVALTGEAMNFTSHSGDLRRDYEVVAYSPSPGQFATIFTDITDRIRLERQLRQAQKMEAIGRLAGGIAHDFNNLLTTIIGHCDLLTSDINREDEEYQDLQEIRSAAKKATSLTRQLLTFSRREAQAPTALNINSVVQDVKGMMRRLIGEDVELNISLAPDIDPVLADPTQIEQIIMNLAINARDAMPEGGKLSIETANVELDTLYAEKHALVEPGPYVMLAVSDAGIGMDEQTQEKIFEPFFTTKGEHEGTGLGLATVYAIVKQSGGHIWVYSEEGHGTTFKVYLPRATGAAVTDSLRRAARSVENLYGTETILVVEDEPMVRKLAGRILRKQGYQVLAASDGQEAIHLVEQLQGPLHLLVTDVVLPGINGRVIAETIVSLRPEVKVIYVSGYTDNALNRHGVLEPGTVLVEKPFTPESLARKVREVLDDPAARGS